MTIGDVIHDLRHLRCKEEKLKEEVVTIFKNNKENVHVIVGKNGRDFFYDKRFDIDYQITFRSEAEPVIKMKVEKDIAGEMVKIVDAWV